MDELNHSISISYSFFQAQKSTTCVCVSMSCEGEKELTPNKMTSITLLGIIISHHKSLLSGWFSISPRGDMLGPWRVYSFKRNLRFPSDILWFPYDSHGAPAKSYAEANGIFVLLDHRPNHLHSPQKTHHLASCLASADTASLQNMK